MLINDLNRYFKSFRFIAFTIVMVIALRNFGSHDAAYFDVIRTDPNFSYNSYGYLLFSSSVFSFDNYFLLISIVISMIFSYMYLKEKNSKFGTLLITRMGYKKYYLNKLAATIITTFITVIVPLIIYLLYCIIFYGGERINYPSDERQFFYLYPLCSSIITIFMQGLYAVVISIICLGFSNILKRYYLVIPSSFMFVVGLIVVLNIANSTVRMLGMNIEFLRPLFPPSLSDVFYYDIGIAEIFCCIYSYLAYIILAFIVNINLYLEDKDAYI